MKKIFALIGLVIIFSCTKEECKTCQLVTRNASGYAIETSTPELHCGDDLKAIDGKVVYSGYGITKTYECK